MSDDEKSDETREGPPRAIPMLGIVVIAFLLGALSATYEVWPYAPHLQRGFDALPAVLHKASLGTFVSKYDNTLWRAKRFEGKGVVRHDSERSFDGYTLMTSGHRRGAVLVDMDGEVVHEWGIEFGEIWEDPPHVAGPTPPGFINWPRVHMFPNGDLLALITSADDAPPGYGLVKIDRDSKLIWAYAANAHHDFHVDDDGTIWALVSQHRDLAADPLPGMSRTHMIDDQYVVKLSAAGEELSRVRIHDVMAKSPFRSRLFSAAVEPWDPLHPNQIETAGAAFAAHHDFVEPDDLILSFRNIHAIAVYDPDDERLDWLGIGPWRRQHDVDPMPDGTWFLYDNLGGLGTAGPSRIVRVDPSDHRIAWSYAGRPREPFYSEIRGSQQPLPNGNVLISDCENGRIIEVTVGGDIVWEYLNPHTAEVEGGTLTAILESAVRIEKNVPTFL